MCECDLDVGDDPVAFKWLKQYKLVTADLGFAYRTYRNVHLALHTITRQHEGIYECEATNDAGVDAKRIEVIVGELAASLNDVLAEGECSCDVMFLLHASPDSPPETLVAQANFVNIVASPIVSDDIRVSAVLYSDYVNSKLSFAKGTNQCALSRALKDLSHDKWATRIQPKIGVKVFILEVTEIPLEGVMEMASERGDGKPYHWWIPKKIWPTIVSYMAYMPEELNGCVNENNEVDNVCVGEGGNCTKSDQCQGIGYGCIQGTCQSLECNVNPKAPGCCTSPGEFWCGDVSLSCEPRDVLCDGKIQCMNGIDEERCWQIPCQEGQARCQSSTLCLSMYDLCDGEPHCPGAEDEDPKFCRSFPCPIDRPFRCRNGKCISTDRLCDGTFKDCSDGEDENLEYCSERHVCPPSRSFKCDYGICIPERMICDGAYNCLDALDERICEKRSCPADRPFKCGNGKCVDLALVCNGVVDACVDGLDEKNCTEFVCPSDRSFKCFSGRCIDKWLTCDKRDDCGDGSDELHCDTVAPSTVPPTPTLPPKPTKASCLDDEFFCTSGACLSSDKVCDGRRNCIDGEDEDAELCQNYPCPSQRSFRCPDGACVNVQFCDNIPDCSDGSDEDDCVGPDPEEEEDNDYNYETAIENNDKKGEEEPDVLVDGKPIDDSEPTTNLEDAMLVNSHKEIKDSENSGSKMPLINYISLLFSLHLIWIR
ncbi:Transmembrane protease serine 6 [Armadillidium vulgare]|nr:Transmembrane protease serine 6 [Armadillidium vulgare]